MDKAPWLDADTLLSPEEALRLARELARRWLVLVAAISLLVGGIIGYWGFREMPGPAPALAQPTGWMQPCAPASGGTATLPTAIPTQVQVYVSGAVLAPQVVTLPPGSLVSDALAAAGGPAPDADLAALNLAAPLANHQQVAVPARATAAPAATSNTATPELQVTASVTLINLNTATAAELEQLPRIGPAMAQRILEYREAHGPFQTLEELLNISGIGPTTLEQLRPYVTLGP